MRNSFVNTLIDAAALDERVWLLCGDLGFSVLESFAACYPDRFINVGVAEQNMTGVAAGLALSGKVVFTYSIANFPVMRCLEQIRNDVCYHNLNVKVVAVGGGLSYGAQGYTHHGVEDLAVLRVLPNIAVLAPGDPVEARLATLELLRYPGPGYLRLGKSAERVVHGEEPIFGLGKAIPLFEGYEVTVISTGAVLHAAYEGCAIVRSEGLSPRLLSMPSIAPFDRDAVLRAADDSSSIVTMEEHGEGGVASVVAEVLAQAGSGCRLVPLRLARAAIMEAGTQEYLRRRYSLTSEHLAALLRRLHRSEGKPVPLVEEGGLNQPQFLSVGTGAD